MSGTVARAFTWTAVVHADVSAWIENKKPMIRQADVQHRPELQLADVLFSWIASEA